MSDDAFVLRPYQREAVAGAAIALQGCQSSLLVLPTGCGKTVVYATVARDWPGPVLTVAHREELILQGRDKMVAVCREPVGVEMATSRANMGPLGDRLVIGSIQTLSRPRRLARFDPHAGPWLVLVDEAHHAIASSYREFLDYFKQNPDNRILGVTATPNRADGAAMGAVFSSVAYTYSIRQAINDGWLVDVEQRSVKVESLDFSRVRTTGGDLNAGDLDEVVKEERALHEVAAVTHQEIADRPTLVFCVSRDHAARMARVLARYRGESRVAAVDGETPPEDRRAAVARFRSGELQILVNVGLYLEGFDAPNAACVVMARPTKSLALYTQILGRVLRPLPNVVDWPEMAGDPAARRNAIGRSGKPYALVLDFRGNVGRHQIVDAVDVLGEVSSDEERAAARRIIAESAEPITFDRAAHLARLEAALLADQEAWRRRRHIKAQATYRTDSAGRLGANGHANGTASPRQGKQDRPARAPGDGPTEKQVKFLRFLGVSEEKIATYSRRQASAVISDLDAKRKGAAG